MVDSNFTPPPLPQTPTSAQQLLQTSYFPAPTPLIFRPITPPAPPPAPQQQYTPPTPPPAPQQQHAILHTLKRPDRIPQCGSLDDALHYWNQGDHSKGLLVPLKDWENHYHDFPQKSWTRTEAVKFGNIKSVVEEFETRCRGSHEEMDSKYPGLRNQYTKLYTAIREAKKARGEAKSRSPRKPRK